MNNLSWLLYAADVMPRLSNTLGASSLLLTLLLVVLSVVSAIAITETNSQISGDAKRRTTWFPDAPEWNKRWRCMFRKTFTVGLPTVFLLGIVSSLTPSKETFYLIAGSEAGETVVTSESGQEILSDIQMLIKLQLKNLTGE